MLTTNELVFAFSVSYLRVTYRENRLQNEAVKAWTNRCKDARETVSLPVPCYAIASSCIDAGETTKKQHYHHQQQQSGASGRETNGTAVL